MWDTGAPKAAFVKILAKGSPFASTSKLPVPANNFAVCQTQDGVWKIVNRQNYLALAPNFSIVGFHVAHLLVRDFFTSNGAFARVTVYFAVLVVIIIILIKA
jgi:hypothetical protein